MSNLKAYKVFGEFGEDYGDIVFAETSEKAKYTSDAYGEFGHPYARCRAIRQPEFDQYAGTGVPEQLRTIPVGPGLDDLIERRVFGKVFTDKKSAYSTTWENMRLVVEEMKRKGWSFTLQCWGDDENSANSFGATFGFLGSGQGKTAVTAPHAVGLAALKALEGNGHG